MFFAGRSSFQEAQVPLAASDLPKELNQAALNKHAQEVRAALSDVAAPNGTELERQQEEKAQGNEELGKNVEAPELSLESVSKARENKISAEEIAPNQERRTADLGLAGKRDNSPQQNSFLQSGETDRDSRPSKPSVPALEIPSK